MFNVKKRKILPDAPLLYGNEVVISNDDSVIRDEDEKLGRAKTQTLNCKLDQAQLNEELQLKKITIKAKYTICRKILTRRTKLRGQ